ncbi:hypothetical protein HDU81_009959 [Chytriomyces hyalinus]|nr:hypothetical protein HDU81_009959 [Chytriomyces hyalinus]
MDASHSSLSLELSNISNLRVQTVRRPAHSADASLIHIQTVDNGASFQVLQNEVIQYTFVLRTTVVSKKPLVNQAATRVLNPGARTTALSDLSIEFVAENASKTSSTRLTQERVSPSVQEERRALVFKKHFHGREHSFKWIAAPENNGTLKLMSHLTSGWSPVANLVPTGLTGATLIFVEETPMVAEELPFLVGTAVAASALLVGKDDSAKFDAKPSDAEGVVGVCAAASCTIL